MSIRRRSIWKTSWNIMTWIFRAIVKLISFLVLLSFLVSCGVMLWMFMERSTPPDVQPETVLVLELRGLILDGPPVDMMTQRVIGERVQTVQEILRTLRKAAHDDRIISVLIKPEGYHMNMTAAVDIREELLAFQQSGKKIFAYIPSIGMGGYWLISVADRIFMPPSGSTSITGLRAEVPFFKGLFEKIGVTPEFVAIGDYKTAPQVFTMDHMSKELQEQLEGQLDTYYSTYVQQIAEARQVSVLQVRNWIDNALYTAPEALATGMIDELVYESQLEERLARELGLANREATPGDGSESVNEATVEPSSEHTEVMANTAQHSAQDSTLTTLAASEYALVDVEAPDLHISGEKIAVLYASGMISSGKTSPSPTQPSIGSDSMIRLLTSLTDDEEIQGIILRIDSGGGGAMASDLIRNSVQEAAQQKPVLVSMADVAASGGYMIAIPANSIVAYPLTVTGSIGIYGGKFSLEGLSELTGVHIEVVQRGRNAGIFSAVRKQTAEERERFRHYLRQRYETFVAQVAQGRHMSTIAVDEVAQGQVWLGTQALELGLVDALGGLDTAIAMMKTALEIPEEDDVTLVAYPRPGNPLDILRQRLGGFINSGMSKEIHVFRRNIQELLRLQEERVFAWWPVRICLE